MNSLAHVFLSDKSASLPNKSFLQKKVKMLGNRLYSFNGFQNKYRNFRLIPEFSADFFSSFHIV